MFAINECIFYGSGGICRIESIQTAPLQGMPQDREYYVLRPLHDQNSVMYVPVDSDCVFLRTLITREEAERLMGEIPSVAPIVEGNAKLLRERYRACMSCYDPLEWIRVIKTAYARITAKRAPCRRISDTERGIYETAKRLLSTELALATDTSVEQMEAFVMQNVRME